MVKKTEGTNKRRWCRGIMHPCHGCDPGSIPGRRMFHLIHLILILVFEVCIFTQVLLTTCSSS